MYNPYNNYNNFNNYPCPNYRNMPWYNQDMRRRGMMYPYQYFYPMYGPDYMNRYPNQLPYDDYDLNNEYMTHSNNYVKELMDYGPEPFAIDIERATSQNNNFRTALWTGNHLQLTLMSINPREDIGLEMHPDVDQFIRIEEGEGVVRMGDDENLADFEAEVDEDFIFVIPAGKYHNIYNTGSQPLKLYSIYAPPQHPHGTVHETKEDAMEAHE